MSDLDQLRRNVKVMDLLTRSYEAHSRSDGDEAERCITAAAECDAALVSVLQGGMLIGEVPNPEHDWHTWIEYVELQREKLAQAEEDGDA